MKLNVTYFRGCKFGVPFQYLIRTCEDANLPLSQIAETIRRAWPKWEVTVSSGSTACIEISNGKTCRLAARITEARS